MFGAIIAVVSCYKGMTASGGAEGVGRAVNQGVVICFLGIFAFNYVFTQTLLATHPEISRDQMSEGLDMRDIALRIAAAALAFAIVFGSLFLWIGVPVLGMWIAGQLTTSNVGFLFATLGGIPLTMVATGFVIYRLNALYEDVRPGERRAPAVALRLEREPERGARRLSPGPRSASAC